MSISYYFYYIFMRSLVREQLSFYDFLHFSLKFWWPIRLCYGKIFYRYKKLVKVLNYEYDENCWNFNRCLTNYIYTIITVPTTIFIITFTATIKKVVSTIRRYHAVNLKLLCTIYHLYLIAYRYRSYTVFIIYNLYNFWKRA